ADDHLAQFAAQRFACASCFAWGRCLHPAPQRPRERRGRGGPGHLRLAGLEHGDPRRDGRGEGEPRGHRARGVPEAIRSAARRGQDPASRLRSALYPGGVGNQEPMPGFSLRNPYFIIVGALITALLGLTAFSRMPVDVFPSLKMPAVVVGTFYPGMPPDEIENDITTRFERFFTLGNDIEHMESRSLPGVSIIKVFFQPTADVDAAASQLANLAMSNLRHLPPGTLPPIVMKSDASSLPVTLVTVSGAGFSEAQLRDQAQYNIRNQIATVAGASIPPPFGGKYRQIMVYVNREALEARGLTLMDVV